MNSLNDALLRRNMCCIECLGNVTKCVSLKSNPKFVICRNHLHESKTLFLFIDVDEVDHEEM